MVKKQVIDTDIRDIRKLIKSKKLIIGLLRTMKYLKEGKVDTVYISQNCSEKVKADLEYYNTIAPIKIVTLKYPNEEVGTLVKKPFSVSVISVLKGVE